MLPAVAGVLLLGFFDVVTSPTVSINDDWVYLWTSRQLAGGNGFRHLRDYGVLHAPQTAAAFVLTMGHYDPRLLRLTVIPFLVGTAVGLWVLSRRVGANRFWAMVAAATPLTQPVALSVSTGFMTDVFFLALFVGALVFAYDWVTRQRHLLPCIALTVLATSQRPIGVLVVPALALALLIGRRRRPLRRMDVAGVLALFALAAVAVLVPYLIGISSVPVASTHQTQGTSGTNLDFLLVPIAAIPAMLVSIGAPFVLAVLGQHKALAPYRGRIRRSVSIPLLLAWTPLVLLGLARVSNIWSIEGIGPATAPGRKPTLLLALLGLAAIGEITIIIPFVIARANRLVSNSRAAPRAPGAAIPAPPAGIVLLTAAGLLQVAPMVQSGAFDRYYLPVVLPILPVLARVASAAVNRPRARVWAVSSLLAGLTIYAVGEQDYLAWQSARDEAARSVMSQLRSLRVNAGYEANAVYAVIPYFESHNSYPLHATPGNNPRDGMIKFLLLGPDRPDHSVCFIDRGSPIRGFDYQSAAPGKFIVVHGSSCP